MSEDEKFKLVFPKTCQEITHRYNLLLLDFVHRVTYINTNTLCFRSCLCFLRECKKRLHVGPLRSSYSQSLGATETFTSVDMLLKTELVCGLQQENAAEKLNNNHETQRIAPETHHKFKPSEP